MNDDYALVGDVLWGRFNAPKEDILWYYRACLEAYKAGVSIENGSAFAYNRARSDAYSGNKSI